MPTLAAIIFIGVRAESEAKQASAESLQQIASGFYNTRNQTQYSDCPYIIVAGFVWNLAWVPSLSFTCFLGLGSLVGSD
ncbi:hypothetical protein E2542_SST07426 [Spatholobus suberectus]|nr:hypothetical protein E2542_SST07426 [Spatholobus suberectus]